MEPNYQFETLTPGAAVLTVDELKRHLHLLDTDGEDETDITDLEAEARDFIESHIGAYLSPTQVKMVCDRVWCDGRLYLKAAPAVSVQSVKIRDQTNGAYRTLTVDVDFKQTLVGLRPCLYPIGLGWLPLNFGTYYPDYWEVQYTAGFATGACPGKFKRALKLLVSHWWYNREAVAEGTMNQVPVGFDRILTLGWNGGL